MYNVTLVGTIENASSILIPFKTNINGECLVYLYLPMFLYDKNCKQVETSEVLKTLSGRLVIRAMHYYDDRFPVFIPLSITTSDGRTYYSSYLLCPSPVPCET